MNFWLSSFVTRWHTHPRLSTTRDTISGHQQRVLMICLKLMPDMSREGLIYAATHDQGESSTGDLPYTFKRDNPGVRLAVSLVEKRSRIGQGFPTDKINPIEADIVRLADWTDSYLWAFHHEPDMVNSSCAWNNQMDDMATLAKSLGVWKEFSEILVESTHG